MNLVRINEVEPSTSDPTSFEFIELFGPGGQTLDSLTLVLFNGINSQSYYAVDLDGLSLDQEGFLLIAPNNALCTDLLAGIEQNWMQDGTDGMGLFFGAASDWPNGTLVQNTLLVDAIVYGVQNNAPGLTSVLMSGQPIVADNPSLSQASYARILDGGESISSAAYTVQYPTPGYSNSLTPCIPYTLESSEIVLQCLDSSAIFSADFTGGNGEMMSYILTDINDIILGVIDSFPFDFFAFPVGEYRVRAASYSQSQSFEINSALTSFFSFCGPGCFELSDDYVRIIRYSCQEPCIAASITSSAGDSIYRCYQDPSIITFTSQAVIGQTLFLMTDAEGNVLQTSAGEVYEIESAALDTGMYTIYALNTAELPSSLQLDSLLNVPGYSLPGCLIWLNDTIHLTVGYCISCDSSSIVLISGNTDLTYCEENAESLEIATESNLNTGNYSYCIANSAGDILQWNDNGSFSTASLPAGQYSLYGVHYAYPSVDEWQSMAIALSNFAEVFFCFELSSPLALEVLECSIGVPCEHLFISEYIESGAAGRAIELYNPSNQEINLSGFNLGVFQNGDSSATLQIGLQGYVVPGDAYVIASGGGMGEAFADDTTFQLIFNGNDAIALMLGDSIVDVIGQIGQNPGNAWGVDDGTTQGAVLRRNPVFSSPESNWDFSAPQWDFSDVSGSVDDFGNLGIHATENCIVPAIASFETTAILIDESNDVIDFTVNVSGLTDTAYLSIAVIEGTALEGEDWILLSPQYQMVTPGVAQVVFQIQIIDDAVFESQVEYILFQLLDSTGIFQINNSTVSVTISPSDIEYTPFLIEDLIEDTPDGNAIYFDQYAVIKGVTQGINFNPEGLEFPFVQGTSALRVFNSFENFGYDFSGGDSLQIWGRLGQFSGMTEFYPDSIVVIAQGLTQEEATQVSSLDESLESHLVRLDCVELSDTSQWIPNGSGFDVTLQNSAGLFTLHIDLNTDIFNAEVPEGRFDVTGVVVQFDESSPYSEGYSIWPRSLNDLEEFVTASFEMPSPLTFGDSGVVVAFDNNSQGANSYWWDFGDGSSSDTITPVHSYSYDFISPLAELQVSLIAEGTGCSDTSSVTVDLVYSSYQEFASNSKVLVYPNPFHDILHVQSVRPIRSVSLLDVTGKKCYSSQNNLGRMDLNLSSIPSGVYTLILEGDNWLENVKLLKE